MSSYAVLNKNYLIGMTQCNSDEAINNYKILREKSKTSGIIIFWFGCKRYFPGIGRSI